MRPPSRATMALSMCRSTSACGSRCDASRARMPGRSAAWAGSMEKLIGGRAVDAAAVGRSLRRRSGGRFDALTDRLVQTPREFSGTGSHSVQLPPLFLVHVLQFASDVQQVRYFRKGAYRDIEEPAVGEAAVGEAAVGEAAVGEAAVGEAAVGEAAVMTAALSSAALST